MLMLKSTHQKILAESENWSKLNFDTVQSMSEQLNLAEKQIEKQKKYIDELIYKISSFEADQIYKMWEKSAEIKLQDAQIEDLRRQLADAKKRPRRADGRFVSVKEPTYGADC